MKSKRIVAAGILVAVLLGVCTPIICQADVPEIQIYQEMLTETEVEVPEVIIINTNETTTESEQKPFVAETPIIELVTKCRVNAHLTPNVADLTEMKTIDRGVKLEGSLNNNTGWFKTVIDETDYYVYSEFLVTESEWEELSKIPFSSEVPLDTEVQRYLWNECQDTGVDYCFALAIIDIETGGTFSPNLTSYADACGIMQVHWPSWGKKFINLGYITCKSDMYNIYNGIHCGLYLLKDYVAEFGPSEAAAFKYNTGHGNANSSNGYARKTMQNYAKWKSIVYPETTE